MCSGQRSVEADRVEVRRESMSETGEISGGKCAHQLCVLYIV